MEDQRKMAFEFAKETTKQLITLATGILALEITFLKDLLNPSGNGLEIFALLSWISFLLSVAFGVATLMALTGTLEPLKNSVPVSICGKNVRVPSTFQIAFFLLGLIFTVIFGALAICW